VLTKVEVDLRSHVYEVVRAGRPIRSFILLGRESIKIAYLSVAAGRPGICRINVKCEVIEFLRCISHASLFWLPWFKPEAGR
jgi:hypothetical protein